ncbi:hypothetical protein ACLBX9_30160 [Methylobacterium sp. A49B]
MLWTHTGETLMYVGIGALIGVILAGIAQEMQSKRHPTQPPD